MNKAILVGRLTKDPEVRTTSSGLTVAGFTLAINRPFKAKEGAQEADFINVSVFGTQAENVSKYCVKGSQVGVEGRIQTRSYDAQDGSKRYVTEVISERVEFLSSKQSSQSVGAPVFEGFDAEAVNSDSHEEVAVKKDDPFKNFGNEITLSDDDLPF